MTTTHPSTMPEAVIIQRNSADESAPAAHTTTLPTDAGLEGRGRRADCKSRSFARALGWCGEQS